MSPLRCWADGTPVLVPTASPMTATTDENGAYQFVGLAASYRVVIVDPNAGDHLV